MRARWTLMQWNPLVCRFIPKVTPPTIYFDNHRKRIRSIDKLSYRPVDNRLERFLHTVEYQHYDIAMQMCDVFADSIDVNTLRDCCALLNFRYSKVGDRAKAKLSRFSLPYFRSGKPPSKLSYQGGPLKALKELKHISNEELQQLLEESGGFFSPELDSLRRNWEREILNTKQLAEEWQATLKSVSSPKKEEPFLHFLDVKSMAGLVAHFMARFTSMAVSATFPQSLSFVCKRLGNEIEGLLLDRVGKEKLKIESFGVRSDLVWCALQQQPWNDKTKLVLGVFWIKLVIKSCRFSMLYNGHPVSRPAFWQTCYISKAMKKGIIVANQGLLEHLKTVSAGLNSQDVFISKEQIPLLTPPEPWTSVKPNAKNLYDRNVRLITSCSTEGSATVNEAIRSERALPQIKALNRLQNQSWRINRDVLKMVKQLKPPPVVLETDSRLSDPLVKSKAAEKAKARQAHAEKIAQTQWSQALAIAEALGNRKFYLPMYMDFRGRCYPLVGTLLNFMGNDPFRSLFMFGEAKRLGKDGLFWLKVHLSNVFGELKMASFDDRVRWVDSKIDEIIACGENPEANSWWRAASKPYQTLAACIELSKAYAHPEGPEMYSSHLPVQLDGTSNGLQHLVALCKDEQNAKVVNLCGNERGDVYSLIIDILSKDSEAQKHLPANASRSTVKKAVMIYFYGGSNMAIAESLALFGIKRSLQMASILTNALDRIFKRCRSVQRWLTVCAQRIMMCTRADHILMQEDLDTTKTSKKEMYGTPTLVWTSPLGLPVVQPYVTSKLMATRTSLQAFFWPSPYHLPTCDKPKQVASVAANFVHSLDAAHMLATAIGMPRGSSFAAVHDSFWTHAQTVPQLNKVLRDQFVRIHMNDVLSQLRSEWQTRYEGFMVQATVYGDTKLYKAVKGYRSTLFAGFVGAETAGEDAVLQQELCNIAQSGYPTELKELLAETKPVWESTGPYVGTKSRKLPSITMWIPLELPPPPPAGSFDISAAHKAEYLFN